MEQPVSLGIADPIAHHHALSGRIALLEVRSKAAKKHFARALRRVRKLLKEEPNNFVTLRDFAICKHQMAAVYQQRGQSEKAYDAYDAARDLYEKLVKIEGEDGRSAHELSCFLCGFAAFSIHQNQFWEAVQLLEQSFEIRLRRREVRPRCPIRLAEHVEVWELLGLARYRANNP